MSSAVVEEIVSRDGTTIGVWRSGDGPPLVLVHGAAADHSRWAPVLHALEHGFTVLAIDRRGRGASGDANDYAIEREYEDLAAVLASVGEEAADVLGHSYGGICALECALLTAGISKLVLYEAPIGVSGISAASRQPTSDVARRGQARRARWRSSWPRWPACPPIS